MTIDRAVIAGGIILPPGESVPPEDMARLERRNPAHVQWSRRTGRRGPEPAPMVLPVVRVPDGPWAGSVVLPRASPVSVRSAADRVACPPCAKDADRDLADGYQPRPHQSAAVSALLASETGSGVVVAPAGSGKTDIGVLLCSRVRTPAVVLAPTIDIMHQWRERFTGGPETFARMPGASVGLVGAGKDERDADIVVASPKTLVRWPFMELYRWGAGRGIVIYDEAHRAASETGRQVLAALPGRHRLLITATPDRRDGLGEWVEWLAGPVVYRVTQAEMQDRGRVLCPDIVHVQTGYQPDEEAEPTERVNRLCEDSTRNARVVGSIARELRDGRRVLVLTERVAHAEALAGMLAQGRHTAVAIDGSASPRQREEWWAAFRAGDVSCVVATQLADEALDVPQCDCVALVVPSSHPGRTEQRIGRGCRPSPGKRTPRVLDFVDEGSWAERKLWARRQLYRQLGWLRS